MFEEEVHHGEKAKVEGVTVTFHGRGMKSRYHISVYKELEREYMHSKFLLSLFFNNRDFVIFHSKYVSFYLLPCKSLYLIERGTLALNCTLM